MLLEIKIILISRSTKNWQHHVVKLAVDYLGYIQLTYLKFNFSYFPDHACLSIELHQKVPFRYTVEACPTRAKVKDVHGTIWAELPIVY